MRLNKSSIEEAHRIAAELVPVRRDGAVASQADAMLYAHLLCDFGATYTGPVSSVPQDGSGPYVPTARAGRPGPSRTRVKNGGAFCRRISTTWLALRIQSREGIDVGYGYD